MESQDRFIRRWVLVALVYFVAAVSLGVFMAAAHDFRLKGVHVHLNLLGWVSMALTAFVYRLFPAAGAAFGARVHFLALQHGAASDGGLARWASAGGSALRAGRGCEQRGDADRDHHVCRDGVSLLVASRVAAFGGTLMQRRLIRNVALELSDSPAPAGALKPRPATAPERHATETAPAPSSRSPAADSAPPVAAAAGSAAPPGCRRSPAACSSGESAARGW